MGTLIKLDGFEQPMSILFEPYTIRNTIIKNRFMRSATTSAYADEEGVVREQTIKLYQKLAEGDIGLLVKGHLYILNSGKAHQGMAGISNDKHIAMLKKLTNAVHKREGIIVAQINHAGVLHEQDRSGPSNYKEADWVARSLSEDEITTIIEAFGEAAERSIQAGFDGVQIHGAHGYLISQFLSKHVNKRKDQWGGTIENRMKFLLDVYTEVRRKVGNMPVLLKMNCDDFSYDGFNVMDACMVAKTIFAKGLDHLEISGGGRGSQIKYRTRAKHNNPALGDLDFAGHAEKIRSVTRPSSLALVSGFRNLATMQSTVYNDLVDMISLSRPFIREPDLVKKLKTGQNDVTCVRCDACSGSKVFGKEMLKCWMI